VDESSLEYYISAYKMATKEYRKKIAIGKSGYLTNLESILSNSEIFKEVSIGIKEIPLKKIIGTYSKLRSISFASNFMPLMEVDTEFQNKWSHLATHHLKEGITDPIKVYEYLNYYYVLEGNKRVSVLKFFTAYSITADVIRILPKAHDYNLTNKIYHEFLNFNEKTDINCIWFSKEGSFNKLIKYIDSFDIKDKPTENKYKYFENVIYLNFRNIYYSMGGGEIYSLTTGDAFLEYIKLYGIPDENDEKPLKNNLRNFLLEVETLSSHEITDIQTKPENLDSSGVISTLANLIIPQKKLKVAFVYAKTIENSSWTYAHEIGRQHIEDIFSPMLHIDYIENVPENDTAFEYLVKLVEDGYDTIMTTSPGHITATLKASLEYTNIKFFNCSETHFYKHVSTYWGRLFESKFLTGIIAGAMTKTDILGYVATYPVPEVISAINAFALGARFVNPRVRVKVEWYDNWKNTEKWYEYLKILDSMNADIISMHDDELTPRFLRKLGIDSMLFTLDKDTLNPDKYLAAPIWNWKIFYEELFKSILNSSRKNFKDIFSNNSKTLNFWWGMDSGVLDIYYSKELIPFDTQKLVEFMKKMILNNSLKVFSGPIYDQQCNLKVNENEFLTNEAIISMNWFVEAVDVDRPVLNI
jgi:basic membrane lipoprotein Med (substrate-binding protein (PBP1-ABC) superfamily)